jgi:hypothetical protein
MSHFRCLFPALTLVFLGAGSIQSQGSGTGETTNQTVASAQTVAYCDLLEHPEKFKNQMIRVQAIYEADFEKSVITSPSCPLPFPLMIWVEFDSHWESRTPRRARKTVLEVKWRLPLDVVFIGKFMTDGRYGHMDMYPLLTEVYKVEATTRPKKPEHPSPD